MQCLQVQQGAAAMVYDAEHEMQAALRVGLAGEVYSPDEVARNIFWFGVFEVAAQDLDFVAVLLQYLVDAGFADGDFARSCETAVADVGNAAATCLGHEGFEADDFCFEPFGFPGGMAVVVSASKVRMFVAVARGRWNEEPKQDAPDA